MDLINSKSNNPLPRNLQKSRIPSHPPMNCSCTWWLRNPRPPFATAAHHHRCLLDPVLCYCGAQGPPQPPASYGATWWPNVAQNPFTRVPSHHYHQRPIKRGRSPERGFSCYYRAQGPPMCLAAPNDRRVWYNPESRLKRRPQPLLPARRWIELNDLSSSPSVSSDASQGIFFLFTCCLLLFPVEA